MDRELETSFKDVGWLQAFGLISMDRELETSFKDVGWLQAFGLCPENVLDYFATSPFYDPSCLNEVIKMQARFNQLAPVSSAGMTGTEFSLFYSRADLYIIRKALIPKNETLALYYIVNGSIYACPDLGRLVGNHLMAACHFTTKAFDAMTDSLVFHPVTGYSSKDDVLLDEPAVVASSVEAMRHDQEFDRRLDQILRESIQGNPQGEANDINSL